MSRNIKKGLEPLVVKVVAIIMCVCYILSPLHKEIGVFLHEVTHLIDVPKRVLSHSRTLDSGHLETHHQHALETSENSHDHHILDLLDKIFEATDTENKSEDSNVSVIKIDKHTRYLEKYKNHLCLVLNKQKGLTFYVTERTRLGHRKSPFLPPQLF